jgi:hypothetical protein
VLEPWAEEHIVSTGEAVEIVGTGGEISADFEFEQIGDTLIIFAWTGAVVSIYHKTL